MRPYPVMLVVAIALIAGMYAVPALATGKHPPKPSCPDGYKEDNYKDKVLTCTREVIKEVPGPERIVEKEVPGPERIVERTVEVPGPERIVEKEVIREVQVPGPTRVITKVKVVKSKPKVIVKWKVKTKTKRVIIYDRCPVKGKG